MMTVYLKIWSMSINIDDTDIDIPSEVFIKIFISIKTNIKNPFKESTKAISSKESNISFNPPIFQSSFPL